MRTKGTDANGDLFKVEQEKTNERREEERGGREREREIERVRNKRHACFTRAP